MKIHPPKSTRHVDANINTPKENQDPHKSSNEMKNIMLKGHLMYVTNQVH
jgi:hypothetical protein